jgi:hypothetical protein
MTDFKFAKLYYYRHTTWRLGPNAIPYGGWRCYDVPTAVWYGVCSVGVVAPANVCVVWRYGSVCFLKIVTFLYELRWR